MLGTGMTTTITTAALEVKAHRVVTRLLESKASSSIADRPFLVAAHWPSVSGDSRREEHFHAGLWCRLPLTDRCWLAASEAHPGHRPFSVDALIGLGFSGADLHALCTEAAMGPVRDLGSNIRTVKVADVPAMQTRHFDEARHSMRPSVGPAEIKHYVRWNEEFGSFQRGR